jgi:cytidine deaminase
VVAPKNEIVELVFGLAGPVGTNFGKVSAALSDALSKVHYSPVPVRLSTFLDEYKLAYGFIPITLTTRFEDERIRSYQDGGNALREMLDNNAALALRAIQDISTKRKLPPQRHAYIIHSLKRPEEVEQLRAVYTDGFFLIAVVAPRWLRVTALAERIADSHGTRDVAAWLAVAEELVQRDEDEQSPYGQKLTDTFPNADLFISLDDGTPAALERMTKDVFRFVQLLMGCTDDTPTREEAAMFHAHGASLRSGSLARQVGAAITTTSGDLLSVGCNDTPRAGGGIYWPNDHYDHRDIKHERDSSEVYEEKILVEIYDAIRKASWCPESATPEELRHVLSNTSIMGLLEFGRPLHAEMDALLTAGRNGVSVRSSELFTTTFPCHECAKLILGAGITRVVYIEPYPKSQVAHMYKHEIATTVHRRVCTRCGDTRPVGEQRTCRACGSADALEFDETGRCLVCGEIHLARFVPFTGVGPSRYLELFSLIIQGTRQKRKDALGYRQPWRPAQRRPMYPASYLEKEQLVKSKFEPIFANIKK